MTVDIVGMRREPVGVHMPTREPQTVRKVLGVGPIDQSRCSLLPVVGKQRDEREHSGDEQEHRREQIKRRANYTAANRAGESIHRRLVGGVVQILVTTKRVRLARLARCR